MSLLVDVPTRLGEREIRGEERIRKKRMRKNKKRATNPIWIGGPKTWQRPTLPQSHPCSTIGPGGLYFRVRDGNGCGPSGITARN